jgi:hypothetical protein
MKSIQVRCKSFEVTAMTKAIAALNDTLRKTLVGGKIMMTDGVAALPEETVALAFEQMRAFDKWTIDNDPYEEHDFGAFEVNGHRLFSKIEYFDRAMEYGSEDPTDPTKTTRVLTLMLADEW